jgi:hypothetical protein
VTDLQCLPESGQRQPAEAQTASDGYKGQKAQPCGIVPLSKGTQRGAALPQQAEREAAGGQKQDEEFTRRVIENIKLPEEKREAERRQERDGPGRER